MLILDIFSGFKLTFKNYIKLLSLFLITHYLLPNEALLKALKKSFKERL